MRVHADQRGADRAALTGTSCGGARDGIVAAWAPPAVSPSTCAHAGRLCARRTSGCPSASARAGSRASAEKRWRSSRGSAPTTTSGLEQGRDVNPSDQVLDSLARALKLDAVAALYLRDLARPPAEVPTQGRADVVHESTRWMIDSWPRTAAIVHNRYIDVLASNKLARALNPNYRPGVNSVLRPRGGSVRTGPARGLGGVGRTLRESAAGGVRLAGTRRETAGARDRRVAQKCPFREFWARQDVVRVTDGTHVLRHSWSASSRSIRAAAARRHRRAIDVPVLRRARDAERRCHGCELAEAR